MPQCAKAKATRAIFGLPARALAYVVSIIMLVFLHIAFMKATAFERAFVFIVVSVVATLGARVMHERTGNEANRLVREAVRAVAVVTGTEKKQIPVVDRVADYFADVHLNTGSRKLNCRIEIDRESFSYLKIGSSVDVYYENQSCWNAGTIDYRAGRNSRKAWFSAAALGMLIGLLFAFKYLD